MITVPKKSFEIITIYSLEQALVQRLREGKDEVAQELENPDGPVRTESKFGEKLFGKYMNPIGQKLRNATR